MKKKLDLVTAVAGTSQHATMGKWVQRLKPVQGHAGLKGFWQRLGQRAFNVLRSKEGRKRIFLQKRQNNNIPRSEPTYSLESSPNEFYTIHNVINIMHTV